MFISKRDRKSTTDELVRLYSKRRVDVFSRLIITVLAVALLMAPVIALFSAKETGGIKIMIIFLFTMAFSVALSLFTRAKRHEVFAATAAYVIFLFLCVLCSSAPVDPVAFSFDSLGSRFTVQS